VRLVVLLVLAGVLAWNVPDLRGPMQAFYAAFMGHARPMLVAACRALPKEGMGTEVAAVRGDIVTSAPNYPEDPERWLMQPGRLHYKRQPFDAR